MRANPILLLFAIPVLAVTAAMLLAATVVWTVLMLVVLMVGGRHRTGPARLDATPGATASAPPRRGPGGTGASAELRCRRQTTPSIS